MCNVAVIWDVTPCSENVLSVQKSLLPDGVLWNVGTNLPDYAVSHLIRQESLVTVVRISDSVIVGSQKY
jgi:hypothetical protein